MKKVLVVAAVAMMALVSCKKDYTCDCTVLGQTSSTEFKDVKKKDAQEACDEASVALTILDGSCTLK
jgi:hypothetical protein